jgi:predicted nucleic-acid-binding protein
MNVVLDTNMLVRISVKDDEKQTESARKIFQDAATVTIPTSVLCEYVWVLSSLYKYKNARIAHAIRTLMQTEKVVVKDDEAEAGLRVLDDGGDFADGVHAYNGLSMAPGPAVFVSFDKQAVRLLAGRGVSALVPE